MKPTHEEGCLFCLLRGVSFTSKEHILGDSLTDQPVFLSPGIVCDLCNKRLGRLDRYFTHHHVGAPHRLFTVSQTKKGRTPALPLVNGLARWDRGSLLFEQQLLKRHMRDQFSLTFTRNEMTLAASWPTKPADSWMLSRFLVKAAIETLYLRQGVTAFDPALHSLRDYALRGSGPTYVPFAWGRGDWVESDVRVLTATHRRLGTSQRFGVVWLPHVAYLTPLEGMDDLTLLKQMKLVGENFEVVETRRKIRLDAVRFEATFGFPEGSSPETGSPTQ